MTEDVKDLELDIDGPAAPPRANGELVFNAPWESRAFSVALALHRRGLFEWEEFRQKLITEIGAWDERDDPDEEWNYYRHWLAALEKLLNEKGICATADLDARSAEFAARPHGHDH